ncbi:MAG: hypothetical protein IPK82_30530 [Polyangiaceae bacterium]|nr:hypothetical protein [Polyangiaceae bacterium]
MSDKTTSGNREQDESRAQQPNDGKTVWERGNNGGGWALMIRWTGASATTFVLASQWSVGFLSLGCAPITDPNAAAYREVTTEPAPSPRWGHTLVYDGARDQLIAFGGNGPNGKLNDTWAFSLVRETWQTLETNEGPSARLTPAAIFDAPRNRMIVVGGDIGTSFASDETWALDLETLQWSTLPPIPVARFDVIATSDNERAWFYGGFSAQFAGLGDLWELDLTTDTWTERTNTGPEPKARAAGGMAKRGDHLVITMGHDNSTITHDTWEYGLSNLHWFEQDTQGEPLVGAHYGVAFDEQCNTLLLAFGDDNDYYDIGYTSALVLHKPFRFELLPSSNALPPRRNAAAAVDPVRRRMVIFGGRQGFGASLGDTWTIGLGECL